MNKRENLLDVIETLFRWKKQILLSSLFVAIGSLIVVLLLPDYFTSSTVYYVASPDQALPEPVGTRLKEKSLYGQDGDIDRNLTIAQSSELIDYMIQKYDLYKHYNIDPLETKAAYKVREEFLDLYSVKRTKYDAVELSVEDTDRELAATMVNDAREKIAQISRDLIKKSFQQQLRTYQNNIENKENALTILSDSLRTVRAKYGVYNTHFQSEVLSTALSQSEAQLVFSKAKLSAFQSSGLIKPDSIHYMKAIVKGYEQELIQNKDQMKRFNEGMSVVEALTQAYHRSVQQFNLDQERFKQLKSAYDAKPPVLFLVEEGTSPLIKSYPKRGIICISAVLIAFILSVMAILILEAYKDVDWKKITNAR